MRTRTPSIIIACMLVVAGGCGGGSASSEPSDSDLASTSDTGGQTSGSGSSGSDSADAADTGDTGGTGESLDACEPPALLRLQDIPELPALAAVGDDTLAAFEVEGDALVGKFVRDQAAAEGAMALWQELVLRIPANQRMDLVQLNVFGGSDPVAWVDGTGVGNQVGRYGFTVAFSVDNFELDPDGPCAPLSGRRGTFDWTLIHEFHHIRGRADGTIDGFTAQFPHVVGDGEGYPEDGTPALDRDYVTSYAERSSGDEDAAETFTAYVMLDSLPEPAAALATTKVRWFDEQTDYAALRRALRVSEAEGPVPELPPAPRAEWPFELSPPAWIQGTWRGMTRGGEELQFVFEDDNVTFARIVDGVATDVSSYANLRDDGTLATITQHTASDSEYSFTKLVAGEGGTETFSRVDDSVVSASLEALGEDGDLQLDRVEP